VSYSDLRAIAAVELFFESLRDVAYLNARRMRAVRPGRRGGSTTEGRASSATLFLEDFMTQAYRVFAAVTLAATLGACSRSLPSAPSGTAPTTLDALAASASRSHEHATVFTGAGDINASVNAFRAALGTLNANTPGSQAGGRREINWDAVPAANTNTNDFPVDFFNQPVAGRARGTVFSTPGTGFRTSDNNFADVAPAFDGPFVFFSPIRTFAPVGSSHMAVDFFVPGTSVAATSTGFGVVFSDVDRFGSASIRLFDADGRSLGRYTAPTAPGGLSFVGVTFPNSVVARVEIQSGQGAVVSVDRDLDDREGDLGRGPKDDRDKGEDHDRRTRPDLVIMDDFIYGEPIAATTSSPSTPTTSAGAVRPVAR
jgi:hypothetical protein